MAERYVRPPLVAREPRSRRAARIRGWALLAVALLVVALILFLVGHALVGGGEGSPGVQH